MMHVEFIVMGEPQGKARPRFTKTGRAYTPKKTVDYERQIRAAYTNAGGVMTALPVAVSITALYTIPKSASQKKAQSMDAGELLPAKKPDLDNIAKAVCDALNSVAYRDDAQVCSLRVVKRYSRTPCVMVSITEIIE